MENCILIIEDEEKLAQVLKKYMEADGFATQLIANGNLAIDAVHKLNPVMVLLDIMLPEKNGIEICKEIRQFSNVPIIMITAKVEEIDRLLGLELGADDYICKPFSPREVVARVKATLRRTTQVAPRESPDAGLNLDREGYQATLDGANLELTPVEFRILVALFTPPIRVHSRSQLIANMYDDHRIVSDRAVDSHVANLRKKLKSIRPESEHIQPVYGVGYRYLQ